MHNLTFEPVAAPIVLLAAAAALFGLLVILPGFADLSRVKTSLLIGLRSAVICLVLLALLRPGCVTRIEKPQTGLVEVFLDLTRSMELPHRPVGPSRYEALQEMVAGSQDAIQELKENRIQIRWFAFDNELTELVEVDGQVQIPDEPQGDETDIGSSVYAGVQLVRNQRLLATILASDGVQNAVDPQTDLNEAVRLIEKTRIPLFCVPFGMADTSQQLADLVVDNVADQFSVRVKNRLRVSATLTAKGFAGQQIPVRLLMVQQDGQESVVDTRRVPIQRGQQTVALQFEYTPQEAGQYQLVVRAEPQTDETAVANNELRAFLNVEDRGVNVLYVYGNLLWEQKFLRRALEADTLISVDAIAVDQRSRSAWPLDLSDRLGDPKYDVIIFGDLDSRAIFRDTFQEENLKLLTDQIDKGTGFLMLGGEHSFGPGLYGITPLANYLPIEMAPFERQDFDAPVRTDLHIAGPVHIKPTKSHYVTRIGPAKSGGDVWNELPPLDVVNRFVGVKDTAEVLMATESGEPVMVVSSVGGRVMAFAGDTTWKWRTMYSEKVHKRFWRQTVLWLAGQDALSGEDVWVYMPQRRFQLGQTVQFQTGARRSGEEVVEGVEIKAELEAPDGTHSPITVQNDGEQFSGQIRRELLKSPGLYAIKATGTLNGREIGSARTEFAVSDTNREKSVTSANPEQLARLAKQTNEWGGRLVQPEDFEQVLREILSMAPENRIEIPRRWRLGDTWQDALAYLALFVALLTCEWTLRKKWGLV